MALTSDEKAQLQIFSGLSLNKTQVETILRRSLTEREWKAYNRDYRTLHLLPHIVKQFPIPSTEN